METQISGTLRLDYSSLTDTTYLVTTSVADAPEIMPVALTRVLACSETVIRQEYGASIGSETLFTVYGSRSVDHRLFTNESTTINSYIAPGTDFAYRMDYESGSYSMRIEISETDLQWILYR
jgi:hypothetical protein